MNNKEKYIEYVNNNFKDEAKEVLINQINDFYDENQIINKNKYSEGEDVFLKKNIFIHGIYGGLENFDYTVENGFVSTNFTSENRPNKICNSVGMWNIQKDMLLKEYINFYSGITITYYIGRGPSSKKIDKVVPYHMFDSVTEEINNDEDIWMYSGEQTKEVRFIPSLVSNKRQIAFILNTESEYAKKMIKNDVWNEKLSDYLLKPFIAEGYYERFLEERHNKTALTTDRESAIMFGLPTKLIEGVFVGRKIEQDKESLNDIKSKLPDCYICNLDGKVIIGNK